MTWSSLADEAGRILEGNWSGGYTTPASGLYPHQWSWDSAFIAIGLRWLSASRARTELDSLFASQWADGRVPQIVYDPAREDDYQPGAAFWDSAAISGAPERPTTGLVQPPNHAVAAWLVHTADIEGSRQARFLERLYPKLVAWHQYLTMTRVSPGRTLAAIVHPWESGTDNSPLWDDALATLPKVARDIPRPDLEHAGADERPSQKEYGTYYWLAEAYRDQGCDHREGQWRFLFEDPSFNALWSASEHALARIATEIGRDPVPHHERARAVTSALDSLYDESLGVFVAWDAVRHAPVRKATVSGLIPLLLPGLTQADQLIRTLRGPTFLGDHALLVPSYDATAPDHDPTQYWRGPSWFNMTWMVIQGLRTHDQDALADSLTQHFCALALEHDFPEYVDPWTGAPHGARRFSWTAALALDLARTSPAG
ncbi:hypothetical protein G1H11_05125 [Phytoactinopolyspora alkaliphila]|uniref:Mannosylglycerate hydrolase MGH1-like glycoside hydrolase domain-containing protein n=1 Tax=Phytoactinopolyspora alkaliphila TaxID=1783498 RepID=A0A6N9YIA7_9ACTN|nr:trehalase family glycosidase [Phytoactinopolyspora alkaliphila]NED94687.1 hypothetical protein [Phytoactinopolyspora alkaliphila]